MDDAIYTGDVRHRRVRPVRHALSYRVFALFADVDRLDALDRASRVFRHNRPGLVSVYDRDHGEGDGRPIGDWLRGLADSAGCGTDVRRFVMLGYPRILGYVFNPLTVFYGLDATGGIRLIVYEVRNTFGQKMVYVLPAEQADDGTISQRTAKRFYVSPFNDVSGDYTFRLTEPGETLTLGIALRDAEGPLLNASFHGHRRPFNDRALLAALAATGWMTVKVIVGIHLEAARLALKGLRLRPRPAPPSPPLHIGRPHGGTA